MIILFRRIYHNNQDSVMGPVGHTLYKCGHMIPNKVSDSKTSARKALIFAIIRRPKISWNIITISLIFEFPLMQALAQSSKGKNKASQQYLQLFIYTHIVCIYSGPFTSVPLHPFVFFLSCGLKLWDQYTSCPFIEVTSISISLSFSFFCIFIFCMGF